MPGKDVGGSSGRYGEGGPLLIRSYDGTPTVMGAVSRWWVASKT